MRCIGLPRPLVNSNFAERAAQHFAFLIVGATLDRVMFEGEGAIPSGPELDRLADSGVEAFLAAYRPDERP